MVPRPRTLIAMTATPSPSPLRRAGLVLLPFAVVGAVIWALVDFGRFRKPAAAAAAAPAVVPAAPATDIASVASRMLGNSAMRSLVAGAQRRALEQEFGGILGDLGFSADQSTRFLDLLLESQTVVMDASLQRLTGRLNPEEDQQLQRKIDAANDGTLARAEAFFLKEFPGDPGKFAAFRHHSALGPDRAEVAALQQRFTAAQRPLAPKQERDLAEVLHEVRAGVIPALDPEDISLLVLSAQTLAPRIRDQERIDALLRTKAAAVLDAAQLELLASHQADRLKALQAIVDAAPPTPVK
jgi:hypothetical protein